MTSPAILCDTGALLDYLAAGSPDHDAFREAIDGAGARFVPALVLAELDHFLSRHRDVMHGFLSDVDRGTFTLVGLDGPLLRRAAAIDRRYAAPLSRPDGPGAPAAAERAPDRSPAAREVVEPPAG